MSTQLTDAERALLHAAVCPRHRDDSPGVYVCGPCEAVGDAAVERIIDERTADARENSRQMIDDRNICHRAELAWMRRAEKAQARLERVRAALLQGGQTSGIRCREALAELLGDD